MNNLLVDTLPKISLLPKLFLWKISGLYNFEKDVYPIAIFGYICGHALNESYRTGIGAIERLLNGHLFAGYLRLKSTNLPKCFSTYWK